MVSKSPLRRHSLQGRAGGLSSSEKMPGVMRPSVGVKGRAVSARLRRKTLALSGSWEKPGHEMMGGMEEAVERTPADALSRKAMPIEGQILKPSHDSSTKHAERPRRKNSDVFEFPAVGSGDKEGASSRIRVYVRLRPMSSREKQAGAMQAVEITNKRDIFLTEFFSESDYLRSKRSKGRQYSFDIAFPDTTSQHEVYEASAASLVESILEGRNASIFCYGATGAGKTHTMLGSLDAPGVMVLALRDLFAKLQEGSNSGTYAVQLSYMEVYNEIVRDLLTPGRPLVLREDAKLGITASGLTFVKASSADEVMELLQKGNGNRTTEPTRCNETSSRSHAILQVVVERTLAKPATGAVMRRVGKLSLIDLAGSERALATEARTARSMEGANINRSLLALSSCINALVEGKKHIPFRNSKLTQLLKDSLGGACRTAMIANISPSHLTLGETQNTLHWADRAKEIQTKTPEVLESPVVVPAGVPLSPSEGPLKALAVVEIENMRLKGQLAALQRLMATSNHGGGGGGGGGSGALEGTAAGSPPLAAVAAPTGQLAEQTTALFGVEAGGTWAARGQVAKGSVGQGGARDMEIEEDRDDASEPSEGTARSAQAADEVHGSVGRGQAGHVAMVEADMGVEGGGKDGEEDVVEGYAYEGRGTHAPAVEAGEGETHIRRGGSRRASLGSTDMAGNAVPFSTARPPRGDGRPGRRGEGSTGLLRKSWQEGGTGAGAGGGGGGGGGGQGEGLGSPRQGGGSGGERRSSRSPRGLGPGLGGGWGRGSGAPSGRLGTMGTSKKRKDITDWSCLRGWSCEGSDLALVLGAAAGGSAGNSAGSGAGAGTGVESRLEEWSIPELEAESGGANVVPGLRNDGQAIGEERRFGGGAGAQAGGSGRGMVDVEVFRGDWEGGSSSSPRGCRPASGQGAAPEPVREAVGQQAGHEQTEPQRGGPGQARTRAATRRSLGPGMAASLEAGWQELRLKMEAEKEEEERRERENFKHKGGLSCRAVERLVEELKRRVHSLQGELSVARKEGADAIRREADLMAQISALHNETSVRLRHKEDFIKKICKTTTSITPPPPARHAPLSSPAGGLC